jgi:hypothetical protein
MEKKVLEGLASGPELNRYAQPSTRNELLTTKEIKPNSGVNLDADPILIFTLKTGPGEFVR